MQEKTIFTTIPIDPSSEIPLYKKIYGGLRQAILMGQILPGTKMPSTRILSKHLHVSRNTVMNAYNQLVAEGCLVSQQGSGTYVAINLENQLRTIPSEAPGKSEKLVHSARAQEMKGLLGRILPSAAYPGGKIGPFREGLPAVDCFPHKIWQRMVGRASRRSPSELIGGGKYRPLNEAVAAHLYMARGVSCTPDQVIIVPGSQLGIALTGQVLLNPGEAAWVEDPGYPGAYGALHGVSIHPIPVSVDEEGLSLQSGILKSPSARLVFVTPSHQFPLGTVMSFRRRLELLNWVQKNDAWILEDDYDSEFRYKGRPLAALQAIDFKRRVIYMGTFSKVMFPALRLGYIVVPTDLIDAFNAARQFMVQTPPLLEQAALAEFIEQGHFHRHVRRMRTLYAARQDLLIQTAHRELDGLIEIEPTESGMHLIAWLPEGLDDRVVSKKALRLGVDAIPLSNFCFERRTRGALILGFAGISEEDIMSGVQALRGALGSDFVFD